MNGDYVKLVEQINEFKEYGYARELSSAELANEWGEYTGGGNKEMPDAFTDQNDFNEKVKQTKISYINPSDLTKIENTDAGDIFMATKNKDVEEGIEFVKDYFKEEDKDIDGLLNNYQGNSKFIPSIILKRDERVYLLGGNTRLSVATVLKIKPPVKVIQV